MQGAGEFECKYACKPENYDECECECGCGCGCGCECRVHEYEYEHVIVYSACH